MRAEPASVQPRRLVPLVAAVVVIAVTGSLGRWQLHRAAEKQALQQALEARATQPALHLPGDALPLQDQTAASALQFRHAVVAGTWLPSGQIYLDNRDHDGTPGWHVLTPLQLRGRPEVLLVNRGFVPRDAHYPQAPAVSAPEGAATLTGTLAPAQTRYLELSAQVVRGAVWQNLHLAQYAQSLGRPVLPVLLLADPTSPELLPVHEAPSTNIAMHQGYAFQWFALAAATALITLYFQFWKPYRQRHPGSSPT